MGLVLPLAESLLPSGPASQSPAEEERTPPELRLARLAWLSGGFVWGAAMPSVAPV
jgi:hypothetical protein